MVGVTEQAAVPRLIPVTFQGDGSGVERLSWGQWELWEGLDRLGTWMPIGTARPLPPGTTVDTVVDRLRFLMSQYQTMRTRLRFDPDGPKQVVYGSGEITLEEGVVQQSNFNDYPVLRMNQMPRIEVHIMPSTNAPTGVGEPGTPPTAPAVANAIAQLGGKVIHELPFSSAGVTIA